MPGKNYSKPLKVLTGVAVGFALLTIILMIVYCAFPVTGTAMKRLMLLSVLLLGISGVTLVIFAMAISEHDERAAEEIYRKPLAPERVEQAAQLIPEMACKEGFERVGLIGFDPEHRMELYVRNRTFSRAFLAFLSADAITDEMSQKVSRELLHMLPPGDRQEMTRVLLIAQVKQNSAPLEKLVSYGLLPRSDTRVSYVGAIVAEETAAYWSSLNLSASGCRPLQKVFLRCIKPMTVRK